METRNIPFSDKSKNNVFRGEQDSSLGLPTAKARQCASNILVTTAPTEVDLNLVVDESHSIVRQAGFDRIDVAEEFASPWPVSPVHSRFAAASNPQRFFKGRVFRVIWSEPAGIENKKPTTFKPNDHEKVFSKLRWIVVLTKEILNLLVYTFGGLDIGKRLLDAGSSMLVKPWATPTPPWPQHAQEYLGEPPDGGTSLEQRGMMSVWEDYLGSSKNRLGGTQTIAVRGTSAKYLPRFHSWTSSFLTVLFFLGGVDAAPHHHYTYEVATSSSLTFVTSGIIGALFSLPTASMVGITEGSLQKRARRGQSILFTYFIPALAILLLLFALKDEVLDAK
jgi:hypothetical protein